MLTSLRLCIVLIALARTVCLGAEEPLPPVSSMPVPVIPGLGPEPPVRSMKWDYYEHPVQTPFHRRGACSTDSIGGR